MSGSKDKSSGNVAGTAKKHQAVIMEPGFFKKPDRFTSEDYLKASYNGVPFEMSEFDCKERHEHHDPVADLRNFHTVARGEGRMRLGNALINHSGVLFL